MFRGFLKKLSFSFVAIKYTWDVMWLIPSFFCSWGIVFWGNIKKCNDLHNDQLSICDDPSTYASASVIYTDIMVC